MAANVLRVEVVLRMYMHFLFISCTSLMLFTSFEYVNIVQALPQSRTLVLATHEDCADDVKTYCGADVEKKNDFAIMNCLQKDVDTMDKVSENCQHLIYSYKHNLTKDGRFDIGAGAVCKNFLQQVPECNNLIGQRIPCLIENMEKLNNTTDGNCLKFLKKMANIVFSDYRLVYQFMERCEKDITKYKCGRLDGDNEKLHAQGKVILCLAKNITKLETQCKKQVLRVAELQSDDYHLDRPLYYACRDAREKLCASVNSGGGKVFHCLFKKKNDPGISQECRDLLIVRQQLIAEDVKVAKTFFTACQTDMKQYCMVDNDTADGHAKRSKILLCLESALKRDHKLSPLCIAEMTELRKSLLEDYQITPEIVASCHQEIELYCKAGDDLDKSGKTIHCLMENANPRAKQRMHKDPPKFTIECKTVIDNLMKEADVAQDFTIDKVLAEACHEVLDAECKNAPKSGVINCLMEKVDSDHMTDECEDRLLEIQYFIVRDFRLDPELYRQCNKDAVQFCHAPDQWIDTSKQTAENGTMIFPCLYRHMKDNNTTKGLLSQECKHEVKRVMKRRAKRIDLDPEIEMNCLPDLGAFCSDLDHYGKGKEMSCLQDNLDALSEKCQARVRDFTEDEDDDLDLDTVLMRACTPMIKKFCNELLDHDAEASEVMECLVDSKNHHEMDEKCRAGIEHHQLIQLKDYKFSHKFKDACKSDIVKLCHGISNKTGIVVCLSETTRDDILKEGKFRVSAKCREQLRVEVLRRGENIELDPELKANCKESIQQFCKDRHAGNAEVIECLKDHQEELTSSCHQMIFKREVDEALLGGDYLLFRECKSMIKTYCSIKDANEVLECLQLHKNEPSFDTKCKSVVMKRSLQETKDYRLNAKLAKNCRADIPKFCSEIIASRKEYDQMKEFEGQIIKCLKIQFTRKKLSNNCHEEIQLLVQDAHLDIKMDPVLMHACEHEMREHCGSFIEDHEANSKLVFQPSDTGDKIVQCLQDNLKDNNISLLSSCGREISRFIEEAHVDINIDQQLHVACQQDLLRWCQDIAIGQGKKMSCLLSVLEDYPDKMKSKCHLLLSNRKALWEYAVKEVPAQSLLELGDQVLSSPAKPYLLGMLFTIVGVIFIVGITCGRVTKRVSRDQKMK